MKTTRDPNIQLLEENRKLTQLYGRYRRNLNNNSSENILEALSRDIRRCENRIARLHGLVSILR